jgi:hypothetical protein
MKAKNPRRGILLLLILALLAMFGMVAVAFVMLSSQTLRGSIAMSRQEKSYHPPANETDEALMQVLRGTLNPVSKMQPHSLLEDLYGNNSVSGTITGASSVCGGQLIEITTPIDSILRQRVGSVLTIVSKYSLASGLSTRIVSLNPMTGNPQILAFPNIQPLQVPAALPTAEFVINGMPFSGTGVGANPLSGQLNLWYALNSTAQRFQLTGNLASYNAPIYPVSLIPFLPISTYTNALSNPPLPALNLPNGIPFSQVNEDYDAADYQNMLLATPPILSTATFYRGTVPLVSTTNRFIPSMHRPALVRYWYQLLHTYPNLSDPTAAGYPLSGITDPTRRWYAIFHPLQAYEKGWIVPPGAASPPWASPPPSAEQIVAYILDIKRKIIGRPLTEDHPHFDGSNPTSLSSYCDTTLTDMTGTILPIPPDFSWERGDIFPPPAAPDFVQQPHLDVDNDGDGIYDSNWIDLGFPVRTTPDGRHYKPLVAIYCVDLDGRLNLNAHGSLAQTNVSASVLTYSLPVDAGTDCRFASYPNSGLRQQASMLRGQGIGPADINLAPIFSGVNVNDYRQLLTGLGNVEGRYGIVDPTAGIAVPGKYGQNYLGYNKYFNMPDDFSTAMGDYGNFADLKASVAIGLDPRGQPLYQNPLISPATSKQSVLLPDPGVPASNTNPYFGQLETNPYAIDLSPKAIKGIPAPSAKLNDNPFSVAELERILRIYDPDANSLPARLTQLTTTNLADSRHILTTESRDIPCPSPLQAPSALRTPGPYYPETDLLNPSVDQTVRDWIKTWYPLKRIPDLLTAKYYNGLRQANPLPADANAAMTTTITWITDNQSKLLPPEFMAGLKMNLNRPLGNKLLTQTPTISLYTLPGVLSNVPYSFSPTGQNPLTLPGTTTPVPAAEVPLDLQAKQLLARHLFVLALLLRENGAIHINEANIADPGQKEKLTIRRLAQWAINAVDYMTPDSIMTPFEYDENPFTAAGWRVDGRIGIAGYPSLDDAATYRGLVWGCKSPDLLLTENINFHDRRAADTDMDPTNKKRTDSTDPDTTLDQPQIPQGSTFFELYCTRNDTNPQAPADLYSKSGNRWYLDLGRVAPAWTAAEYSSKFPGQTLPDHLKRAYPIWRVVIGESNLSNPNNNASQRFQDDPNLFTPQTRQIEDPAIASALPTTLLDDSTHPITIDRIIWFTNTKPITKAADGTNYHADADRIYYYRAGSNFVPGGEYLVVGPRWTTHIGSKAVVPGAITPTNFWGDPSAQTLSLNPVGFVNNASANWYPDTSSQIKIPQAMIVGADLPASWSPDPSRSIGLSISEPIPGVVSTNNSYYQEPTVSFGGVTEWYGQPDQATTRTFLPEPADSHDSKPLGHEHLLASRTTLNYKTFYLQRLANPSEPFEPTTNPYITVDWMPADLTVFNGMDYVTGGLDPDDPAVARPNNNIRLASRQRGHISAALPNDIWPQASVNPATSTQDPAGANLVFPYNLNTTLGYLNIGYWDRTNVAAWKADWDNWDGSTPTPLWRDQTTSTLPNSNSATQPWITSYTLDQATGAVPNPPVPQYYGDPLTPFTWLAWNNRPYNSINELKLVPSDDPGRMFSRDLTAASPFSSLLNFMMKDSIDPGYPPPSNPPPSLYRILDYLTISSPFINSETQASPLLAANTMGIDGQHSFHPPFNRISAYCDTGKINLNTIYNPVVFQGLMNSFPGNWQNFVQSRRGYGTSADILEPYVPLTGTDPRQLPTEFARPFRSFGSAYLVPPVLDTSNTNFLAYNREINATAMRYGPGGTQDLTDKLNVVGSLPLFQNTSSDPATDTARNPYFANLGDDKLANLTTTRSNVYAVWITVGYFEVEPLTPDKLDPRNRPWLLSSPEIIQQAYPDGCELGQELGSDTGEIVRHRSFYIIDRSIPVGFQRGYDLNVEKTILLKRYIE